ncbi:MAG: hypothetical protein VXW43_19825, partial [Pseudomonadota bacterium]|nr:hypothetical protein [Pseudomonadota bacterium]
MSRAVAVLSPAGRAKRHALNSWATFVEQRAAIARAVVALTRRGELAALRAWAEDPAAAAAPEDAKKAPPKGETKPPDIEPPPPEQILLLGVGALVLVGVFATELASESWDLVQREVKLEEEARQAAGNNATALMDEEASEEGWDGMLGPFNSTAASEAVWERIPLQA